MRPTAYALLFATILCLANLLAEVSADQPSVVWLRGSGDNLELRVHGEVSEPDGRPASKLQVAGSMNATLQDQPLEASIDGHRFELWIPVNQPHWYSTWLRASSMDSDRVAYAKLNQYQLRQAAIDGIKLTLESPIRQVAVSVIDQGQPVSGATVKAELGFGIELSSTTDKNGVATLALLPKQELSRLTAWTNDHRIGGFTFSRKPPRDPEADEHVIELSKCRDQKVRFLAEDGSPVPGIRFVLQIATPSPNYNYIGQTDHPVITTDAAGEAVHPWFPDWKDVHFYADIDESNWIVRGEPKTADGVAIFTLKERKPRKIITGRVVSQGTETSPGGFYVHLRSFQGEREHHSDLDSAFSNPDGTFEMSVLPDATYCAYVQDERWVGKITHLLPYESALDKITSPQLTVAEGQPVEIVVSSGPNKIPIANLTVSFRRDYQYTWLENGESHTGVGGPQWWVVTDEFGRAITQTLPGQLTASIYSPRWRTEKSIDVVVNKPAQIALHREIDEERTVTGRIVLDADAHGSFDDVEIHVGSLDGNYEDQQTLKCKSHGLFSFDTFASVVGIFACTKDGKAAGSIITNELAWRIKLPLRATSDYHGQLLGKNDQPVVNHPVHAYIRLEGKRTGEPKPPPTFDVKRIDAKTDEQGNFTLPGIPSQMKVMLMADALEEPGNSVSLGEISLEPNETRPRTITRLAKDAADAK